MPVYKITAPDGKVLKITAPDGATQEDVLAYAQAQYKPQAAKPDFSNVQAESSDTVRQPDPVPDTIGRQIGLGARSMLRGAYSLPGIVLDPVMQATGLPTSAQAADQHADFFGLPEPVNAAERVSGDVTSALTGGGGFLGTGRALATKGAGIVQRGVSDFLSSMPRTQLASIVGGAGSAGITREAGGGQGAQTIAGLAGGLAPGVASTTGAMGLRGLMRGGEGKVDPVTQTPLSGRVLFERNMQDFRSLGAEPSVSQAAANNRTRGLESLLAGGPTSSGVMSRAAERQAESIGGGLQDIGARLSPAASGEDAGRAILRGVTGQGGFKEATKATQTKLYDELDALIDPQSRVGVGNAEQVFPLLNPTIPGAPNLSPLFQNGRIRGIGEALSKDVWGEGSVATRPGMAGQVDDMRTGLQAQADEIARLNDEAAAAVEKENIMRGSLLMRPKEHVPYPVTGSAEIDAEVASMLRGKVDGKLPYEALKKLRTLVGAEIENAGLMSDVPRSKWKALYGALSQDMRSAAEEAGPAAVQAWSRANSYTKHLISRMETIAHVIDKNGGPEKVYGAALSGTKDGATTLRAVMQSLPKEGQQALTGAVVKRMGLATPSQNNDAGALFSAQTFLTNWNRLSPEARKALFDRHGARFSADMDKVARVASNLRDGSRVFANPSGTANKAAAFGYAGSLATSIGAAPFVGPVPFLLTAGGGIAANAMARAMVNPKFVSWLARSTELPASSLPQQLQALNQMAKDDPDVAAVAAAFSSGQQPPQQAAR